MPALDRARLCVDLGWVLYEALAYYDDVLRSSHATAAQRALAGEWADWSTGRLRYEAGDHAEAAEAFARLVDGYPENHAERCAALLWLAACYRLLGAHSGARQCYEAVLRSAQATESQRVNARDSLRAVDRS